MGVIGVLGLILVVGVIFAIQIAPPAPVADVSLSTSVPTSTSQKSPSVGGTIDELMVPLGELYAREKHLLAGLSESGRQFFSHSMEMRTRYAQSRAYKYFERDRDTDGKIDVMDANGYLHLYPGNNGYAPNSKLYENVPSSVPGFFYRYVKDCETRITIERQVIYTIGGYANYIGSDRYSAQCIADGSPDNYYVESATALEGGDAIGVSTEVSAKEKSTQDTTPPEISLAAGESATAGVRMISAATSDNVGVTKVDFLLSLSGPTLDWTIPISEFSAPYIWSWDTRLWADGQYMISARAWDAAGNNATAQPMPITVHNGLVQKDPSIVWNPASIQFGLDVPANTNDMTEFLEVRVLSVGKYVPREGSTDSSVRLPSGDIPSVTKDEAIIAVYVEIINPNRAGGVTVDPARKFSFRINDHPLVPYYTGYSTNQGIMIAGSSSVKTTLWTRVSKETTNEVDLLLHGFNLEIPYGVFHINFTDQTMALI